MADEATILSVKGRPKISHPGDDYWILAKKGMPLRDEDRIKTFVACELDLALDSSLKNIVRIKQKTEITVKDIKRHRLYMPSGSVLSVLESLPEGSSFEVHTPSAIAGVAGSGIAVDTDGKKTYVKCFEDKAYVRGIDLDGTPMSESVYIGEGYKRLITRFDVPGELIILAAFEMEEWMDFRENLQEHIDALIERIGEGDKDAAFILQRLQDLHRRHEKADDDIFEW